MTISDFIVRSRKRLWIVALTAVLAATAAFVMSIGRPQTHSAVASVTVVQPSGAAPTGQVVSQSVENLRSALDSRGLAQLVSEETGVPLKEVRGSLSSRRLRTGNVVEVIANAENAGTAVALAESAALVAVRLQSQSDLAVADQDVALAQSRFEEADSELTDLIINMGFADPEAELSARTVSLQRALAALEAADNDDDLAGLAAEAQSARAELDGMLPEVLRYRTLVLERDAAFELWSDAIATQLEAKATATVATEALVVTPNNATTVSRRQEIAQSVIAAAVLGIALGAGILVAVDILPVRPRGRRNPLRRPRSSQTTPDGVR